MTAEARSPWTAPPARGPVRATVRVPGSKSITNRALLLAGLAGTRTSLSGALRSRDTDLMMSALAALGVPVAADDDRVTVGPHAGLHGPAAVDCGLAGTVMRFVPPLAALAHGAIGFDGDPRARQRPLEPILAALRTLGAVIDGDGLPFVLHGTGTMPGGPVRIDASASSQFVSGLLLSAARYDDGVTVIHDGPRVPSMPHVAMTVAMLRAASVVVDDSREGVWAVEPGPVTVHEWDIEPDLSNAAAFLAAAAATGGRVTVPGWPRCTTQAGDAIRPILEQLGAAVRFDASGVTVTGPDRLQGIEVDLGDVGELTPTVAALAALARTPSSLRGIGHLRGHEADRLAALATELAALGGRVRELPDGLELHPAPLRADPSRPWRAHDDHRMATAGALLGLVVPGLAVDDVTATGKTLPDFEARWAAMLAGGAG